jgi:hypothetical protein
VEAADKDVSKWENQELNYQKFMKTKSNKSVKDWSKGRQKTEKKRIIESQGFVWQDCMFLLWCC